MLQLVKELAGLSVARGFGVNTIAVETRMPMMPFDLYR